MSLVKLYFREDGFVVTANHVLGEKPEEREFKVRFHGSDQFRRQVTLVERFSNMDIAVLKIIPQFYGQKFPFFPLHEAVPLGFGEKLVVHGHSCSLAFSTIFGTTCFPYNPPENLPDLLKQPDLTLEKVKPKSLAKQRLNFPIPKHRTVGGVVSVKDRSKGLLFMHPNLPVIQESGFGPSEGMSGCPVFKHSTGQLVGIVAFTMGYYNYHIPVDVLNYVLETYVKLPMV